MLVRPVKGTDSGKSSTEMGSTGKILYKVSTSGTNTRYAIEQFLWANDLVPGTYVIVDPRYDDDRELVYKDLDIQHEAANHWIVTINYVDPEFKVDDRPEEGKFKFRGSGSSKTVRLKQAIEHIASYAAPGLTAPDHKGAILVVDGVVEGIEVKRPYGKISYTFSQAPGVVDEEFTRQLTELIGQVNQDEWHGYEAGELIFEDFDAEDPGDGPCEVTLEFEAEPNTVGATYGDITGVDHDGQDFIWFENDKKKDADSKRMVAPPSYAHVERIAERTSYEDAFGF